jgi:hypothetical protein
MGSKESFPPQGNSSFDLASQSAEIKKGAVLSDIGRNRRQVSDQDEMVRNSLIRF